MNDEVRTLDTVSLSKLKLLTTTRNTTKNSSFRLQQLDAIFDELYANGRDSNSSVNSVEVCAEEPLVCDNILAEQHRNPEGQQSVVTSECDPGSKVAPPFSVVMTVQYTNIADINGMLGGLIKDYQRRKNLLVSQDLPGPAPAVCSVCESVDMIQNEKLQELSSFRQTVMAEAKATIERSKQIRQQVVEGQM